MPADDATVRALRAALLDSFDALARLAEAVDRMEAM